MCVVRLTLKMTNDALDENDSENIRNNFARLRRIRYKPARDS